MKTPREILTELHRNAEPKLDAIRHTTVAAVCDRRSIETERRSQTAATIARMLWCELILPARRIWTGLAAAWLLILVANHLLSAGSPRMMVTTSSRSADFILALREQEQMLVELTGRPEPKATEPRKQFAPQPRSERSNEMKA